MDPIHDVDNLDHDPKLAEALGQMVVAWAWAETLLANVFACISDTHHNDVAAAYFRIPTFESRVKFLRALLGQWETKRFDRGAIDKAIAILSRQSKTRNGWVHATWGADDKLKRTMVIDMRSGEGFRPVKTADVQNHVTAVRQQASVLLALVPLPYEPDDASR